MAAGSQDAHLERSFVLHGRSCLGETLALRLKIQTPSNLDARKHTDNDDKAFLRLSANVYAGNIHIHHIPAQMLRTRTSAAPM
eukprot:1638163-Amphidinium_carterae.1